MGSNPSEGAGGVESGPGHSPDRWAVMEADIWGPRQAEPSLSPAAGRLTDWAPTVAGWPVWRAVQMG